MRYGAGERRSCWQLYWSEWYWKSGVAARRSTWWPGSHAPEVQRLMEVLPTMRIYGSSPLYNYVELIFRCKRLFIVSIILGTVIISTFAYTRPTHYDASILVALAGKADVVR